MIYIIKHVDTCDFVFSPQMLFYRRCQTRKHVSGSVIHLQIPLRLACQAVPPNTCHRQLSISVMLDMFLVLSWTN